MNKKTLGLGLVTLSLGAILITPTADAFWGMGKGEDSTEKFTEFQQMIQSFTSWDDFKEAMKLKRDEDKAERDAMKEKIIHEVVKTENGVIITVTSDEAAVVEGLKARNAEKEDGKDGHEGRHNEDVTREVVEIENGLQITMTTDDAEELEKMHERADNGWDEKGFGKGDRKGKREQMKGGKGMRAEGEGPDGECEDGHRGQRGGMRGDRETETE